MSDHSTTDAGAQKNNWHHSTFKVVGDPEKEDKPKYVLWHNTF